jgi:hypothetical protein
VIVEVFGLLALRLIMVGLPMLAAMLLAARWRVTSIPVLLAIGLAAGGALAMLDFWLFYADPIIGKVGAITALTACATYVCWAIASGEARPALLGQLGVPLALWCLGTGFIVFLGFLHGGANHALSTSADRFTGFSLPSDNDIPQYFTSWFYTNGHHGIPPVYPGGWEMSDRPPLQIGYELLQRPWGWDTTGLNYQLVGVALQQLWIIGLWALLVAARLGRVTRGLTMLVVLLSDVAIVNGFYGWPKLLPTAMMLAAAALIITPLWTDTRRSLAGAGLIGALFALAMLGHGSSLFAVIPLAIAAAVRRAPGPRWLIVFVLAGAVLYLPWNEYQKYGDPPGSRLTKWFLGGDIGPDNRKTLPEIIDAYRHAGVGGTISNKAENFATLSGGARATTSLGDAATALTHGHLDDAIDDVRVVFFFFPLPSLAFLLAAPFMLALARWRRKIRGDEWGFVRIGFAVVFGGSVIWALIMWGGTVAQTVLHQGSYAIPLVTMAVAVVAMRVSFPRAAIVIALLNMAFSLAIYVPALDPNPGTHYGAGAIVLTLLSLVGFGALALGGGRPARQAADGSARAWSRVDRPQLTS